MEQRKHSKDMAETADDLRDNPVIQAEQIELVRLINRFKRLHLQVKVPGVNPGDMNTLVAIGQQIYGLPYEEPPVKQRNCCRVSELVQELPVPAPAVSRSLKNLEQMGYVERFADETDRRNTLVRLTEHGEAMQKSCKETMDAFTREIFFRMGHQEVRSLLDSLQLLMTTIEDTKRDLKNQGKGDTI